MRTEGDLIRINEWLRPLSWLYGLGIGLRNQLFEMGILKSQAYDIPVIAVGNITVGGSGKTPHVEYLVRLLHDKIKVGVLSRGYKRRSKGYVLASADTPMSDIGDEPYQMKQKFGDIYMAVDKKRTRGIERLTHDEATQDVDVILLDDAYQHRYVKPGVNILLVDYHRLIIYDTLLPAGRLREPQAGKRRADMVIVTKCPKDLKPMEFRVLRKAMGLYPYQDLYFTTIEYGDLRPLQGGTPLPLGSIGGDMHVLLLTGIASPKQMAMDMKAHTEHVTPLAFGDHHRFKAKDIERINAAFEALPHPRMIVTTEKDATRIEGMEGLSDEAQRSLYVLPIRIEFLLGGGENFDEKIISYVRKNSRNSTLVTAKEEHKEHKEHKAHAPQKPATIRFT